MTSGTVLSELRHYFIPHQTRTVEEKHTCFRFPDAGPLDIRDYDKFLEESKVTFYESWSQPFTYQDSSLEKFEQLEFLGPGTFGHVVLVQEKESKKFYAMKCVNKKKVIKYNRVKNLKLEKLFLQSINYPLAIYLVHCFKDNSYVYFVIPFIGGGELYRHLKMAGKFYEDQAKFYACQVILALEYLHYLDLVYRSLKPENILMDQTGYLKLADFGFCKRLKHRHRTYTFCGTPEYIAPEVILSKGHGKAVDWWAVGVFIYELVAGRTPFTSADPVKLYENIVMKRYNIPSYFSRELKDLIKHLLQVDLSKRYGNLKSGVNDIKQHKWLSSIDWLLILNRKIDSPYKPKFSHPGDTVNFEKMSWEPPIPADTNEYPVEFADF